MSLPDNPPKIIRWVSNLPSELLQAIGHIAVTSSEIEQHLHRIYWKHVGLSDEVGPLITDNLNPKRLSEDILKFVSLDPTKKNIAADLKLLMDEFEVLNTQRNHCIHWIWRIVEQETPEIDGVAMATPATPSAFTVLRPVYRRRGDPIVNFTLIEAEALVNDLVWLEIRMRAHCMEEDKLRELRKRIEDLGGIVSLDRSFADLSLPAPWLDKPAPPDSTPSDRRGTKK